MTLDRKVWVLSGTADGRKLTEHLKSAGFRVFATAVTDYGATLARKAGADCASAGALDCKGMSDFIRRNKFVAAVDATHPFAVEASRNAMRACSEAGIRYVRYERRNAKIPDNNLVHYVGGFREAGKLAAQLGKVIFCTAGSKNLEVFLAEAKKRCSRIVTRVLPDPDIIKKCLSLGLEANDIIAMQHAGSAALNRAILREYRTEVLVTKESGAVGGTEAKVKAALSMRIPVVVVKRPNIEYDAALSDCREIVKWVSKIH